MAHTISCLAHRHGICVTLPCLRFHQGLGNLYLFGHTQTGQQRDQVEYSQCLLQFSSIFKVAME